MFIWIQTKHDDIYVSARLASPESWPLHPFKNQMQWNQPDRRVKASTLLLSILSTLAEFLDHQKMISTRPQETSSIPNSGNYCCMMMRVSVDCKCCQKKLRRILLSMKEVETHTIDRQFGRVSVCGRFRPSDVAVKVQKGMNRRVGILEIQEFDGCSGGPPPYG